MSKIARVRAAEEVPAVAPQVTVQIALPMLETLRSVHEDVLGLCVATGLQVLDAMMEQDRTALCGPKWRPRPSAAKRTGSAPSAITLGGRRVAIRRLRARGTGRELALPSFAFASSRDPLDSHTFRAIARGVSTRGYHDTLEALPATVHERSCSRSAVSRRFIALSAEKLREVLSRPLTELGLRVVVIDGIVFREHAIVVALGVAQDGTKHVLALREGATENSAVVKALLEDLIERGFPADRPILFVIDGSKALRRAIRDVFGSLAEVQRCQVHKTRNVLEHLPEVVRPRVWRVLREAWELRDARLAERRLRGLAASLERDHPGAAASLLEGLPETMTLRRLGVAGALYCTLRSTNSIENLNDGIVRFTRNVKHWQGGAMLLRWLGAAVLYAEHSFRRLRGYRDMQALIAALDRQVKHNNLDSPRNAA